MAIAATYTITGSKTGGATGSQTIAVPQVSINPSVPDVKSYDLSSGFNQIAVPDGATIAIIEIPDANAQTLTLKGVTGDTGIPMDKTKPTILSFAAGTGRTFGITAGGTVDDVEITWL